MSHMFGEEYEATSNRDDKAQEPVVHSLDPQYHDYSVTYRSLGESSRRRTVALVAAFLVTLVVAVLGVAMFFYVGG
jgi:hypothetical protein